MNEENRYLNVSKEADEILQELGLFDAVEEFLESEDVEVRILEAEEELIERMEELQENAPTDEIAEKAREIIFCFKEDDEENFKKDVHFQFKLGFIMDVSVIFEEIKDDDYTEILLSTFYAYATEEGIPDIEQICEIAVEEYCLAFLECIYADYVPEGLTEEQVQLLKTLIGGPVIPLLSIFPNFFDEFDDEDETDD